MIRQGLQPLSLAGNYSVLCGYLVLDLGSLHTQENMDILLQYFKVFLCKRCFFCLVPEPHQCRGTKFSEDLPVLSSKNFWFIFPLSI